MSAIIVPDLPRHYPVLLKEIISIISPQYGGTFIDCTFGQGGYSQEILKYQDTKVIALDRDKDSKKKADIISEKFSNRFLFKNKKFSELDKIKLKNESIRGVIFDLGYSYTQIKDPKKGLSFNFMGDLNMCLGINNFSAKEAVNNLETKDLEKIFKFFGEEKEAKRIAKKIGKERQKKEINTQKLVEIIEKTKRKRDRKINSSTKVFQALRIFVNKEISELINGLIAGTKVLKKDGILVVVTFHSLEDKIVKYFFKTLSEHKSISRYLPKLDQPETSFKLAQKKVILPSRKELNENLSSRSAKLRYIIKKDNSYQIKTDIFEKFDHLIQIENLGDKL